MGGIMKDLHLLSAGELLKKYQEKTISPVDVIKDVFDAIDRHDGKVNAFVMLDKEGAFKAAEQSAERWAEGKPIGQIDGVPTTVKDVVIAKGWPTLRGSKTTTDEPSSEDAPSVARLREQGAVLIGKTTTPEFGWKGVTDSARNGITRNPWNLEKTTEDLVVGRPLLRLLVWGHFILVPMVVALSECHVVLLEYRVLNQHLQGCRLTH